MSTVIKIASEDMDELGIIFVHKILGTFKIKVIQKWSSKGFKSLLMGLSILVLLLDATAWTKLLSLLKDMEWG